MIRRTTQNPAEARSRASQAFSIIELMVSMAILALITVYLTELLVRQSRTYTVVDQVTEVQQNVRAISDLIEREMRTTGFMTDEAAVVCGVDGVNRPDVLVVSDASAFNPTNQSSPDIAVDVVEAEYTGTGTNEPYTIATIVDGNAFYDLDGNGTLDGDFFDVQPVNGAVVFPQGQSGGVIIFDRSNPGRGTSCGRVVPGSVGANTLNVDFTFGMPPADYAPTPLNIVGSDLWMVPAVVYQLDQPNLAVVPPVTSQLLRNGLVIAEDVEDIQLAMWFDLDGDGTQENGEYFGSPAVGGPPLNLVTGGQYNSVGRDHRRLREIRLNLMLRTRQQDPNVVATGALPQGLYQNMENRNNAAPPADGFVRRIQTLTIRPRNVGLRSDSL